MNLYKHKFLKYKNKIQYCKTITSMNGGGLCNICYKPANIVYLPCKHNTICRLCFDKIPKENLKCDICKTQITEIKLLSDIDSIKNIDYYHYKISDGQDINDEKPLNKFLFSLLKEENYFRSIDNIMLYISNNITGLDERKLNDLKEYILLLIEKETLKENYVHNFISEISRLNERTNQYVKLIEYLNSTFEQELLANVYNNISSVQPIDPENLQKVDLSEEQSKVSQELHRKKKKYSIEDLKLEFYIIFGSQNKDKYPEIFEDTIENKFLLNKLISAGKIISKSKLNDKAVQKKPSINFKATPIFEVSGFAVTYIQDYGMLLIDMKDETMLFEIQMISNPKNIMFYWLATKERKIIDIKKYNMPPFPAGPYTIAQLLKIYKQFIEI